MGIPLRQRVKRKQIISSILNSWVCNTLFSSINQFDVSFADTVGQHSNWSQGRWKLNLVLLSFFIVTVSFLQRSVIRISFWDHNIEGKKSNRIYKHHLPCSCLSSKTCRVKPSMAFESHLDDCGPMVCSIFEHPQVNYLSQRKSFIEFQYMK